MKKISLFLLLGIGIAKVEAQTKTVTDARQLWFGYLNQTRLTDRWGLWADFHLRTKDDFTNDLSQSIARAGLTYYLNDAAKLTAGYAYVTHYPAEGHKDISQPEHRIWQQLQWHTKYPRTRLMQYIRLEEKYRHRIANDSLLAAGYTFNYKVRYNIAYEIPLTKGRAGRGALSAILNDELHVNFGKQIVYNYFDQNRAFAGLKFNTSAHDNIQVGYMNVFQQLAAGNRFRNTHVIRLFYYQNLDLRRKKEI
ncbi:MAG TPA: DUF2490 domain-containing protein [Niastella sp.]|nr:DUF2490 domain-containing protein [Niastella sp.]